MGKTNSFGSRHRLVVQWQLHLLQSRRPLVVRRVFTRIVCVQWDERPRHRNKTGNEDRNNLLLAAIRLIGGIAEAARILRRMNHVVIRTTVGVEPPLTQDLLSFVMTKEGILLLEGIKELLDHQSAGLTIAGAVGLDRPRRTEVDISLGLSTADVDLRSAEMALRAHRRERGTDHHLVVRLVLRRTRVGARHPLTRRATDHRQAGINTDHIQD